MLIWVWTRDDETGLLDDEFKDGDIFQTQPDSFEPSIGNQEKKSFLITKVVDPPNLSKVEESIIRSEYAPGPTVGDDPVVRRKRIYNVNWRTKFSANEVALIESANDALPDGPTEGGGVVTSGVISDLFTFKDFNRK
jgi:hypothetical protein